MFWRNGNSEEHVDSENTQRCHLAERIFCFFQASAAPWRDWFFHPRNRLVNPGVNQALGIFAFSDKSLGLIGCRTQRAPD
ncbi:MAG: hypothetical protein KDE58_10410 [Caldilineaceae bacterium]|nr:hypothetical protein [Caldilineaceae bacterium]